MKPAYFTGTSGLMAFQERMNTIGHNMANLNTAGYKKENSSFQDLLYNDMYVNSETKPLTGHGVRVVSAGIQYSQGDPQTTGGMYDFAIVGDGLFAVEKGEEIQYTRDGSFVLTAEDSTAYLTTIDGAYVLDADGNHIEIPNELDGPNRVYPPDKEEGDTSTDTNTDNNTENKPDDKPAEYEPTLLDQIGVYRFPNPGGLLPVAGNRYVPGDTAGEVTSAEPGTNHLLKGFLEGSNANMMDGMVEMIAAQRAFQISARVVQTADENEQTINNLRK